MGKHFSFGFKTENIIIYFFVFLFISLVFVNNFCFFFLVFFIWFESCQLGFGFLFFILIAKKSYQDRLKSSAKFTIINYVSIINILHNDGLHRTLWQTTRLELIHIHRILLNILTLLHGEFVCFSSYFFSFFLIKSETVACPSCCCCCYCCFCWYCCLCWFGVLIKRYLYCLNNEWGRQEQQIFII